MTASLRLLSLATLSGCLLSPVHAQTAVWIAQGNLATIDDWNTPGYWDTGVVPNGPGNIAVINQVTPAVRNVPNGPYTNASNQPVASVPGGALAVVTGPITLDLLRLDLPAANSFFTGAVYVGNPGTGVTGSLRLEGAGLDVRTQSFVNADVNVTSGSSLTLANQARFTHTGPAPRNLFLSETTASPGAPAQLLLRDDAALENIAPLGLTVLARGAADIVFQDRARAGSTTFRFANDVTTSFHNSARAETAVFNLGANNLLLFDGNSTAASSSIIFAGSALVANNSTIVRFAGQSSAGQSSITTVGFANNAVEFTDQATGGSGNIFARRLDISGATTGTGTTGRQRATSSALAPTTVVANDTRTITVGNVNLTDLLLGSNTLEVTGGSIFNLRDTGGAYLSAAGENLAGGGLLKTGPGTLTLSAPLFNPADPAHPSYNVISGATTVRQGTLALSNRLADVTVEPAGTLLGGGFITGRLVNQGRATVTAAVAGDFVQSAGGIFGTSIFFYTPGSTTVYGPTIAGNASLAGTITVNASPSLFARWQPGVIEVPVLTASSITGRFGTLDAPGVSARLRFDTSYSATAVKLRLELVPFAALGTTPGAMAFGNYLDGAYRFTGSFFPANYNWLGDSLTFATNREQVAETMAVLGPDRYGAVLEHGFAAALARRTALDRAVGGNQAPAGTGGNAVFAEGGRRRLTFAAVDGLPRAESSTNTWLAGGRWQKGAWTFGGYVASEKSDLLLDDAGSTAKIDSIEPGAFVRFDAGNFFVHAAAGFSRDRYELQRIVTIFYSSNTRVRHTAVPGGGRTDLSLTAGRTWQGRNWSVSPFAGVVFSRWALDDFTETTDNTFIRSQLNVTGWSRDSRRARAGFEAAGRLFGGRLQPRLTVAWWHEFEQDRSIPARLVGAPSGYLAPGLPAETDFVQGNLELDYHLGRGAILYLSGGGGRGRNTSLTSDLSAGFQWTF